jgi:hypothetical protein
MFSLQFFMREMKNDSLMVIHTTRTPILYILSAFETGDCASRRFHFRSPWYPSIRVAWRQDGRRKCADLGMEATSSEA